MNAHIFSALNSKYRNTHVIFTLQFASFVDPTPLHDPTPLLLSLALAIASVSTPPQRRQPQKNMHLLRLASIMYRSIGGQTKDFDQAWELKVSLPTTNSIHYAFQFNTSGASGYVRTGWSMLVPSSGRVLISLSSVSTLRFPTKGRYLDRLWYGPENWIQGTRANSSING